MIQYRILKIVYSMDGEMKMV